MLAKIQNVKVTCNSFSISTQGANAQRARVDTQCTLDYIIINGVPGVGKTTLSESLVYMWSCDDLWSIECEQPYFQLVLILYFRQLNRFKNDLNVTPEKILSYYYPGIFKERMKEMKASVLLILEGFDEFSQKNEAIYPDNKIEVYLSSCLGMPLPRNKNGQQTKS